MSERQLVTEWSCDFRLLLYPFGTQRCTLVMYTVEPEIFIRIGRVKYTGDSEHCTLYSHRDLSISSGPRDLNLYSVVEVRYCLQDDVDEAARNVYQGLLIEFFLRKPLTGDFLTQILPTTLFVLIRFY